MIWSWDLLYSASCASNTRNQPIWNICTEKKTKGRLVENVIYMLKRCCETCWVLLYTKRIFYRKHYCEYPEKNKFVYSYSLKKGIFLCLKLFFSLIHLKVLSRELDPAELGSSDRPSLKSEMYYSAEVIQ